MDLRVKMSCSRADAEELPHSAHAHSAQAHPVTHFMRVYESNRETVGLSRLLFNRSELFQNKPKCSCKENEVEIPPSLFADSSSSLVKAGRYDRKVLVIYTGGTIGMTKNAKGVLANERGKFENLVRTYPQLHDREAWRSRIKDPKFDRKYLILPENDDMKMKILYRILEYDELLDSSNMNEEDWVKIAQDINIQYLNFDGFVVLHGTDTLPYTASALSFMFENIGKPVVLTGAVMPIFEPRSDAPDNIVSAVLIAGGLNIPEVTIYFGNKLFRGNRCRKTSTRDMEAFASPNFVPIVEVGINMHVNKRAIFYPNKIQKFKLHPYLSKNVGLLRLFPNITVEAVKSFLQSPMEGVVLETYGSGNMPTNRPDINEALMEAINRGVMIVNITQCLSGTVALKYETGMALQNLGVLSGYDMTPEAALAKLSYVVSKLELTLAQKKELLTTNIRGELTSNAIAEVDQTLADALIVSLNIQSPKMLQDVVDQVYHALVLYAIEREDKQALRRVLGMGADVNAANADSKPPLHVAIAKGNLDIVAYLLKHGASVHMKTRTGDTALMAAINVENEKIIKLLLESGASILSIEPKYLADNLANSAKVGDVGKLEVFKMAGADLEMTDEMGQTPLHKAVICNQIQTVRYLWEQGFGRDIADLLGLTPEDYARRFKRDEILAIFTTIGINEQ